MKNSVFWTKVKDVLELSNMVVSGRALRKVISLRIRPAKRLTAWNVIFVRATSMWLLLMAMRGEMSPIMPVGSSSR